MTSTFLKTEDNINLNKLTILNHFYELSNNIAHVSAHMSQSACPPPIIIISKIYCFSNNFDSQEPVNCFSWRAIGIVKKEDINPLYYWKWFIIKDS